MIAVVAAQRVSAHGVRMTRSRCLSNRGKRRPMGERGTVAHSWTIWADGNEAHAAAGTVPFDTILQPGTSTISKVRFDVSSAVGRLRLSITTRNTEFPIGWLIISERRMSSLDRLDPCASK